MSNCLGINISKGTRILLKASALRPEYKDEKFRKVKVIDGAGSCRDTIGDTLYVEFEYDGEKSAWSSYNIERLLNDDE